MEQTNDNQPMFGGSLPNIEQALLTIASVLNPKSAIVGYSRVPYTAVATGSGASSIIPNDDTIPQITEGVEYMSINYTPKVIGSKLIIKAKFYLSNGNATQYLAGAVFLDGTSNALGANQQYQATLGTPTFIEVSGEYITTSLTPLVFKGRAGSHQNTTTTFNGVAGARIFGAIEKSFIEVSEFVS